MFFFCFFLFMSRPLGAPRCMCTTLSSGLPTEASPSPTRMPVFFADTSPTTDHTTHTGDALP
eukprot:NODE_1962_length_859_cov_184.254321_g1376_i0.p3 GENE.NODE_1962_length_859_cov_184.254321_g1376_i0~~NODE_1962_length_859_cov_184.254321_g1376_i0.p3  ORF type:complete len:62 (-),score=16.62 NODE_1962_length_859_cov_184.254321_g1376_i0:341-526(-)